MADASLVKPKLRGVLHQWAALVAAIAGVIVVVAAKDTRAAIAGAVYAGSLVLLFTVSAAYHRITWSDEKRAMMRRADHAMIFVLIAGTYTPFMMVPMPQPAGQNVLTFVWCGAFVGIVQSLFWIKAPKFVTAVIAVAVGWSGLVYWNEGLSNVPFWSLFWLAVGGAIYTLGAVAYALKRPNPWPATFGYHEVFHACTLVAAVMHYAAVWFSIV